MNPILDRPVNPRTRGGLLSVCSWCNRARNEAGTWTRVERSLLEGTDMSLTHGVCPECLRKHFPHRRDAA